MGVSHLWQLLPSQSPNCQDPAGVLELAKAMDGKKIAVDVAIWIVEAQTQTALLEAFKGDILTCSVKLVFERVCGFLRFGATPILVLDGRTTQAKAGRLGQRYTAQTGIDLGGREIRVSSAAVSHNPIVHRVKELAEAMGIPVVQAPGEAEATCAALNAAGLVDGVQSKDVDSLLFGAQVVYKTLKLNVSNHKLCEMIVCDMAKFRDKLGIKAGGTQALQVMGVLAGGDFNIAGVANVGPAWALDAVLGLLTQQPGAVDDSDVGSALIAALEAGPDSHLLGLNHCTGCKTCGHDSGCKSSKKSHGRGGCVACGTQDGCVPSSRDCTCEFHRHKSERFLAKVVELAHRKPGVIDGLRAALQEYTRQCKEAQQTVRNLPTDFCRWQRRPSCQAVVDLLTRCKNLEWQPNIIRLKLRPVLIEWDLLQGPAGGAGVEWRPRAIQKAQGQASKNESHVWQFVLHLDRLPGVGTEQEQVEDREWLSGVLPRQVAQQQPADGPSSQGALLSSTRATQHYSDDGAEDGEAEDGIGPATQRPASQGGSSTQGAPTSLGNRIVGKAPPPDQRTFRAATLMRHWPELIRAFFVAQAAKAQPKPKAPRKPAAKGLAKASHKQAGTNLPQEGDEDEALALPQRGLGPVTPAKKPSRSSKASKADQATQPTIDQFLRAHKSPLVRPTAYTDNQGCNGGAAGKGAGSTQECAPLTHEQEHGEHQAGTVLAPRQQQGQGQGKSHVEERPVVNAFEARIKRMQAERQKQQQQQEQQLQQQQLPDARLTDDCVLDMCTPGSPTSRQQPHQPAEAAKVAPLHQRDVIDLCSDSDEEDLHESRGQPGKLQPAGTTQSPQKRVAGMGLASPSKRPQVF